MSSSFPFPPVLTAPALGFFVLLALQSDDVVLSGPGVEASVLYQRVNCIHVGERRIDMNNKFTLEKFCVTSISFIQCLVYAASQKYVLMKSNQNLNI